VELSVGNRRPLRIGGEDYHEVVDLLLREADALDERRHHDWLAMLTEDIRYLVPVRVTTAHSLDDSFLADMAHFDEDRYSLTKRVERFDTEFAWAEDPPSRTRRFVTNVRAWSGDREDELLARSNLLLFRSRGDVHGPDLLSARRTDLLRRVDGELRIARREALLDESVLRTQNFAVFV
jgi:phthalate 3,4-dioxygenase subunit beta